MGNGKKAITKIMAITIVVALIIGLVLGYLASMFIAPTTIIGGPAGLPKEILIGGLLPLTGPLASFGENDKAAVEIAVEEINAFLKDLGIPSTVKFIVEDSEVKPAVALEKLTSL
ncbi:MAG: ABC transporter substrate-binding protein, partial [Nitrososphaerota archaeon]